MTRKEQSKILDDKTKANTAQYNLDRMNAEISAYSSGDLSKYEYLTNKDLGYKPDSFEKAKFEYSPLGKVITDGLDKSDKKEGLLKRLKNIEDKSNNQLLALRDINRPAIRGRNNGGYESSNSYDDYKKIKAIEGEYKDEDNLDENVDKEFDDMVRRSKDLESKTYIIGKNKSIYSNVFILLDKLNKVNKGVEIYNKNKNLYKNSLNIEDQIINSKKYAEGLKKIIRLIDSNKIRIGKDFVEASTIAMPWIDD